MCVCVYVCVCVCVCVAHTTADMTYNPQDEREAGGLIPHTIRTRPDTPGVLTSEEALAY